MRRKDADFVFLRKHLNRCFPHLIVPPCPKEAPKLIADRIKKREKYYARFLQRIASCEELKTSKFFVTFLSEKDFKALEKTKKDIEKIKDQLKNRPLEELITISGKAKVALAPNGNSQKFCQQMHEVTDSYQTLYREMIGLSKELTEKA